MAETTIVILSSAVTDHEKAYYAEVWFTYYHCGGCHGHKSSRSFKVSCDGKNDAVEKASEKIRDQFTEMEVSIDKIHLHSY